MSVFDTTCVPVRQQLELVIPRPFFLFPKSASYVPLNAMSLLSCWLEWNILGKALHAVFTSTQRERKIEAHWCNNQGKFVPHASLFIDAPLCCCENARKGDFDVIISLDGRAHLSRLMQHHKVNREKTHAELICDGAEYILKKMGPPTVRAPEWISVQTP